MLSFKRNTIKTIHVNSIDDILGTIDLIDIREPYEYRSGTLKTAVNIPMRTLLSNPEKHLMQDKPYYIICQSGGRSQSAVTMLTKSGYDVTNVAGGVGSYVGTQRQ